MSKLKVSIVLSLVVGMFISTYVVSNSNISYDIWSKAAEINPKLVRNINVKNFGAKGDGKTDDSQAIQKAINELSNGGSLYIPKGTYMLGTSAGGVETYPNGQLIQTALILDRDNTIIYGDGTQTILKLMPNKKMRVLSIKGNNITVQKLSVNGNKEYRNGTVQWPNGDVVDALVYASSESKQIKIRKCEVYNGIEDGIGFWKSEDGLVENVYSHDNGTDYAGASGISISANLRTKVSGNELTNNTIGIWSAFGSKDIVIEKNIVKNNSQEGIIIGGFSIDTGFGINSGFKISENTIEANGKKGFAGISIASSSNGSILLNRIYDNFYDGIQVSDNGINRSSNWSINQNDCRITIPGRQQYDIRILGLSENIATNANNCNITNN